MDAHCWSNILKIIKLSQLILSCSLFNKILSSSLVLLLFIQISKATIDFIIYCLFNYERGPSLLF